MADFLRILKLIYFETLAFPTFFVILLALIYIFWNLGILLWGVGGFTVGRLIRLRVDGDI